MAVEQDDILKIAELARLRIGTGEVASVTDRITRILDLVDQLQAADTEGVAPMANPHDATQRLRMDQVTEGDRRDDFQAIAPAVEDGLYLVPRVID